MNSKIGEIVIFSLMDFLTFWLTHLVLTGWSRIFRNPDRTRKSQAISIISKTDILRVGSEVCTAAGPTGNSIGCWSLRKIVLDKPEVSGRMKICMFAQLKVGLMTIFFALVIFNIIVLTWKIFVQMFLTYFRKWFRNIWTSPFAEIGPRNEVCF